MKQFAILFAAVCAMAFMTGQAEAQCGGGGYGGYRGYSAPVYRPVYSGSYGGGFGGYGVPYRGGGGISVSVGRGFSGGRGFSSFNRGFGGFSRGFSGYGRRY